MKAFSARNGKDMGSPCNAAWARAYFNRKSVICCKIQLHELRHVLIAITKTITRSLAEKESGKIKSAFLEAGARMSNHSLETEDGVYAGEAHIAGIEGPDRDVFKKISEGWLVPYPTSVGATFFRNLFFVLTLGPHILYGCD